MIVNIMMGIVIIILIILLLLKYKNKFVMSAYPIRVDHSSVSGYGVFATRDIRKGEIIEECPYIDCKQAEIIGKLRDYVFTLNPHHVALAFGYGSMYNHQDDTNAEWAIKDKLEITALKNIKQGEEIFINYGNGYWKTRSKKKI